MIIVTGNCKRCESNWRIPDSPDFSNMEPDLIDIALQVLRIHCPTGTCHARLGTISVMDLSTDPVTMINSSQDSAGNPIYSGDTVRYRSESFVIDAVKVGKNDSGASLLRLVGCDELVSEWNVDRVE